jgi:hypothetical protein
MEIEKLDKQKVKSQDRIRVGSRIKNEEKEGKERQTRMRRRGELSFVIQLETMTSDESRKRTVQITYGWTGLDWTAVKLS